jgi:hypothetical protein
MKRTVVATVTKEQAVLLDSLSTLVLSCRKATEDAERQFTLAARAMFAGLVSDGTIVHVDTETAKVTFEVGE